MIDKSIHATGCFTLKVIEVATGKVLEEYEDKNLVITLGHTNIAKLLGGATAGKPITKIGVGTSGVAPALTDTALTGIFSKVLTTIDYPEANSVRFFYELATGDANGMSIKEFGLLNSDDVLFARKIRTEIVKTSAIALAGSWKIYINS